MNKLAWALVVPLLVAVPASAQEPQAVLDAPLRGFGPADLRAIAPLLEQGVVGMIEHDRFGPFPAAHYAAAVDAPPERVFELLSQPERFPEFMPAVGAMRVVERNGRSMALEWSWQSSVFALEGRATMTLYAPTPAQRARGYRVVIERTDGDLGRGREVWRVLPRGARGSLVTLSTRMNPGDANYVTRQMRGQSLSRSLSATLGLGMLLRTRAEAERRAGRAPRQVAPGLDPPTIESVAAIDPILRRGDLVVIDANGTDLGQASFMSVHGWPEDQIRSILRHPVGFASGLLRDDAVLSSEHTEDGLRFDWRVSAALVGMGGTMTLSEAADGTLALDAVEGTLQGGAWRLRTQALPNHETVMTGWARFDPAGAHPLLGAIVDADPSFRAGLAASAQAAFVRAMRSRLLSLPYGELLPPP